VPPEGLIDVLSQLADVLHHEQTLGAALARIAAAATVSVPNCAAASIAISIEGRPATAAITARVALELDMVQYDSADGACIRAFDRNTTLRIDLVDQGDVFPHLSMAARTRGVRSVLSVPATWGDEMVGTLNLYSRTEPFDEKAETSAAVLAAEVAIAISRSPEFASARGVAEQAQRDVDDQMDIARATGLVMVNEDCTAQQAAGLLRNAAATDEKSVLEIAHRILREQRDQRVAP